MFFTFFELHKWYRIAQNISIDSQANQSIGLQMIGILLLNRWICLRLKSSEVVLVSIFSTLTQSRIIFLYFDIDAKFMEKWSSWTFRRLFKVMFIQDTSRIFLLSLIIHRRPLYSQKWSVLRKQLAAYNLSYIELLKL